MSDLTKEDQVALGKYLNSIFFSRSDPTKNHSYEQPHIRGFQAACAYKQKRIKELEELILGAAPLHWVAHIDFDAAKDWEKLADELMPEGGADT